MNKNILSGIGIVAIIGLLLIGAFKTQTVVVETPKQPLSGVSSPDIQSPYLTVGGVTHWYAHTEALTQATTTVCALQSPAATSTMTSANITFVVSSTTATTITLARSPSAFSTTTYPTNLGTINIAANSIGTAIASTTGIGIFTPNQWFVVSMAGGTAGTFSPTGVCQATWQQLNY